MTVESKAKAKIKPLLTVKHFTKPNKNGEAIAPKSPAAPSMTEPKVALMLISPKKEKM